MVKQKKQILTTIQLNSNKKVTFTKSDSGKFLMIGLAWLGFIYYTQLSGLLGDILSNIDYRLGTDYGLLIIAILVLPGALSMAFGNSLLTGLANADFWMKFFVSLVGMWAVATWLSIPLSILFAL